MAPRELGMRLVYDVCHNIAKIEAFKIDGVEKKLCVHRKGATRAYPAGHEAIPARYQSVGQPVLIPGDMGTGSFVLVGQEKAMSETFGSACHGAGRVMSRTQAIKSSRGRSISRELADQGVTVMAGSKSTLGEEMPEAYKNLQDVVQVMHESGIARKVARLKVGSLHQGVSRTMEPVAIYSMAGGREAAFQAQCLSQTKRHFVRIDFFVKPASKKPHEKSLEN